MAKKVLFLITLLIILILTGCENKESEIFFGFEINTNVLEIPDSAHFSYHVKNDDDRPNLGYDDELFVGKAFGIEARSLLKFSDFDDSLIVDSASLMLFLREAMDTTITFNMGCYRLLNEQFFEYEANWQEYNENYEWDEPGGDFSTINLLDNSEISADDDTLEIKFNSSGINLVQQWVDAEMGDTSLSNLGILLKGMDDTDNNMISFYSREDSYNYPALRIVYHTEEYPDSLFYKDVVLLKDCSILSPYDENTSDLLNDSDEHITLASGINVRSYIDFNKDNFTTLFDVEPEMLPFVSINKAELKMKVAEKYFDESDNLYYNTYKFTGDRDNNSHLIEDIVSDDDDGHIVLVSGSLSSRIDGDSLNIDITSKMQQLISQENVDESAFNGLIIRCLSEKTRFSVLKLDADNIKLNIIYSKE